MGFSKSSSKKEVNSNAMLPQEARKASNRQPNSTSRTAGKKKQKTLKVNRRKQIIKIRTEINEKGMKEQ